MRRCNIALCFSLTTHLDFVCTFPTDFPVVSYSGPAMAWPIRRGFPTDFPVVSLIDRRC